MRCGEEGIKILAPNFRTVEEEGGENARILCSFKVVKVFDVSQTVPLPGAELLPEKPRPEALPGSSPAARTLAKSLEGVCEAERLELRESGEELDALYSPRRKLILLRETLADDQKVKSLTHELAHHLLHRSVPTSETERPTLEAEAEGTAYAVLSYFGVDASGYSFAYVAHWAERREKVKGALASIQRTAREIIEAIEDGWLRAEGSLDRGAA